MTTHTSVCEKKKERAYKYLKGVNMKERAAVSKGQHTVQGSELAAFLAVWKSGWENTSLKPVLP